MRRSRRFRAPLLVAGLWLSISLTSCQRTEPRPHVEPIREETPPAPGQPQSFTQDVSLYPSFPWLVRRAGFPAAHLGELSSTGLGPFDPTNHAFSFNGSCGLRYSSLSNAELWEPDAAVARYFEPRMSDGWYFVHDFPLIVADDDGTPWLYLGDGTGVHFEGSPLRPHRFYPGELMFSSSGSTLTHEDGSTMHFAPASGEITQMVSRIETKDAITRFTRDGQGRVTRIVHEMRAGGDDNVVTIAWDDAIARPVRVDYWQGEDDGSGSAPVRCELKWGAAPRRHLVGTTFIDESPNYDELGSASLPPRNEQIDTVYQYESGVDESTEKLKKILTYRGIVGEAAPMQPLIVATVYISHDGILRGVLLPDNHQYEFYPSGSEGNAMVTIAEGWPAAFRIGTITFGRRDIARYLLRREGSSPGLNPDHLPPMAIYEVEEIGRYRRRFERDPDNLRVVSVQHVRDPGNVIVSLDRFTPSADMPDFPAEIVRDGVTLLSDATYDAYGRQLTGRGRMGDVLSREFYPPGTVLAGAVHRESVTAPTRSGGSMQRELVNEMASGAPSAGLAGSDTVVETRINGVLAGSVGLTDTGRYVGVADPGGVGVRYEATPNGRVSSVRAFTPSLPPSAATALSNVHYDGDDSLLPTRVVDLHGATQAPITVRDGVITRRTLNASGATILEERIELGRRGEIVRITRDVLGAPTHVEVREHTECNQVTRITVNGRETLHQEPRYGCQQLGEGAVEACTVPMEERTCTNIYTAGYGFLADWESWCDTACECKVQYICDSDTGYCMSSPFGAGRVDWRPYGFGSEDWCR